MAGIRPEQRGVISGMLSLHVAMVLELRHIIDAAKGRLPKTGNFPTWKAHDRMPSGARGAIPPMYG
jgi:hypothetical protein